MKKSEKIKILKKLFSERDDSYQVAIDYLRAAETEDAEYLNEIADMIEKLLGAVYEDNLALLAENPPESPESLSKKRAIGNMFIERQKLWLLNQRSSAIDGSE